jgi:hypothetical protein
LLEFLDGDELMRAIEIGIALTYVAGFLALCASGPWRIALIWLSVSGAWVVLAVLFGTATNRGGNAPLDRSNEAKEDEGEWEE